MKLLISFLRRVASMLTVLAVIVVAAFFVTRMLPGDPAASLAGIGASPEQIQIVRERIGVDRPLLVQFGEYVWSILRFDFGTSIQSNREISDEIMARLPATLELAILATALFVGVAVVVSVVTTMSRSSALSSTTRVVTVLGSSAPVYWLALVLQLVFYGWLGWLPAGQRLTLGTPPPPTVTGFFTIDSLLAGNLALFGDAVVHLVLPVVSLALASIGTLARLLRTQMADELHQDYATTVRAKGVPERTVVLRHALPNAINPAITVIGMEFAFLVAGAIFVEKVFQWPGLGSYTWDAIVGLDYPAVSAVAVVLGLVFVLTSFIVDVVYRLNDPRLRTA